MYFKLINNLSFILIVFILGISFFCLSTLYPKDTFCENPSEKESYENPIHSKAEKDDFEASKKTSVNLLKHGWNSIKFGANWFNANYEWTKDTYQSLKNSVNEAIAFIISAIVFIAEFAYNLFYRYIIGFGIMLYGAVMVIIGLVFVPIAFIWDLIFG